MSKGLRVGLLMGTVALLAGCSGFWQQPSNGGGGGGTGSSSNAFYVLNQSTMQIAAYTISSGTLTAVTGSPYTLTSVPYAIAISPNGGFLYVSTLGGIYLYDIASSGALTIANSGNPITTDFANTMQVDATGQWLLEAGPNLAALIAVPVSSSTGLPAGTAEQQITLPAATIHQLAVSPDNTHIFVTMGSSGTEIVNFTAANTSPFGTTVTNIPVKNSAGAAWSVAVDPNNRMYYIGETAATSGSNTGGLRVFSYSSGKEVSGSPYSSGGLAPYSILPLQYGTYGGSYVYVANYTASGSSTGTIAGFAVTATGTNYSLTALGSNAAGGKNTIALAQDSTGSYVLAVNFGGSPDLQAFTLDATTLGKLDSAVTASTGTDPVQATAIAAVP